MMLMNQVVWCDAGTWYDLMASLEHTTLIWKNL